MYKSIFVTAPQFTSNENAQGHTKGNRKDYAREFDCEVSTEDFSTVIKWLWPGSLLVEQTADGVEYISRGDRVPKDATWAGQTSTR